MNLPDSGAAVWLVVLGIVGGLISAWLRARWAHKHAKAEQAEEAASTTDRQYYAERKAVYEKFRQSIHALLDAMDGGIYHVSFLYEVRDQWGELRRIARAGVVTAATAAINELKPMIDSGPTDEQFNRLTRALHNFENACRADRGLDSVPEIESELGWRPRRSKDRSLRQPRQNRWEGSVDQSASSVLNQSDEEAALSRIFVNDRAVETASAPKELMPRR